MKKKYRSHRYDINNLSLDIDTNIVSIKRVYIQYNDCMY